LQPSEAIRQVGAVDQSTSISRRRDYFYAHEGGIEFRAAED